MYNVNAVVADEFFGFLEVDIQIPDKWDDIKYKPKTDLCPRDFYDEFAPIFVTGDIPFESIGEHMKNHATDHKLSTASRTLLVAGLRASSEMVY